MAQPPNPPQFDPGDSDETRLYKQRQFVEEMIRSFRQLNTEVQSSGGGTGTDGYPAQLGYMGCR
ncbi:MAG: hypothetical protein IIC12_03395 [Proteobacteria bacterium]|nr:hypothetical protein [Pseudomonadota bacterium]